MSDQTIELTTKNCPSCGTTGPAAWPFCGTCGSPSAAIVPVSAAPKPGIPVPESPRPDAATADPPTVDIQTATLPPAAAALVDDVADSAQGQPGTSLIPAAPAPALPDQLIGTRAAGSSQVPLPARLTDGRRRWTMRAGAGLAALALVALVVSDLGVRNQLDHTNGVVSASAATLRTTQGDLASTKAELVDTKTQLAATTTERDALRTERDAQSSELSGVKGSLSDAQSRTNLLAGQIETLKSCLNGVSSSLSYFADEYYTSALAALEAVSVSCDKAGDLF